MFVTKPSLSRSTRRRHTGGVGSESRLRKRDTVEYVTITDSNNGYALRKEPAEMTLIASLSPAETLITPGCVSPIAARCSWVAAGRERVVSNSEFRDNWES
jgi:hypothetical protein